MFLCLSDFVCLCCVSLCFRTSVFLCLELNILATAAGKYVIESTVNPLCFLLTS